MSSKLMQHQRIRQIVELIDLTNLDDDCSNAAIGQLCSKAVTPLGDVAAVCVWPEFVAHTKQNLEATRKIEIATVINFPDGNDSPSLCAEKISKAIADGASVCDAVPVAPCRQSQ